MMVVAALWTRVETHGTQWNEGSTSISAWPRFDLSCWMKKTVVGARSLMVRWRLGGTRDQRLGNPRFRARWGLRLVLEGLGRKLGW